MYIVQVASEIAPMAKVGGLSDVMMGLSRELVATGHTVDIIIPKYDCLECEESQLQCIKTGVKSYFEGAWHDNSLWKGSLCPGVDITFLESHHQSLFFERGCIYGCDDDINRFLYFSRAVLDALIASEKIPDIIHVHDWMAAAVVLLMKQGPFKKQFENSRAILTIHNMAYQGKCQSFDLDKIGLQGAWFESPERMQDDFGHDLNLLKGAIVFSDYVTTVSETYAKEVMTAEYGMGLHPTLQKQHKKFIGIVNGLDYTYWNPKSDPSILHCYDSGKMLINKEMNKKAVVEELSMVYDQSKPLVVVVSRLVQQKGVALIRHALTVAEKKGMQVVVLGTAPDPVVSSDFATLCEKYKESHNVRILLQQKEKLAHMLYAAADIVLVPSLFEPCGLTQLIALRYGAVPVVRKTGGLADTVFDVDYSGKSFEQSNGFCFDDPDTQGLDSALDRALSLYKNSPARWKLLVKQAMNCDFSWKVSAERYLAAYTLAIDAVTNKDLQVALHKH